MDEADALLLLLFPPTGGGHWLLSRFRTPLWTLAGCCCWDREAEDGFEGPAALWLEESEAWLEDCLIWEWAALFPPRARMQAEKRRLHVSGDLFRSMMPT